MVSRLGKLLALLLVATSAAMQAALSRRGLALGALGLCALFVIGPWLRPPISRDFRGKHLPWGLTTSGSILPESEVVVPRPWRAGSLATFLLPVIGIGALLCIAQPRATHWVFGVLLAVSIPAFAATLWNHPALIDFFEDELTQRGLLRGVFEYHGEHLLAALSPDRLTSHYGGHSARVTTAGGVGRLVLPFRYLTLGPILLPLALVLLLVATPGDWGRRLRTASFFTIIGVLISASIISRRAVAEYHWSRAETLENQSRFEEAANELTMVAQVMPSLSETKHYWFDRGRLDYRQQAGGTSYAIFYLAQLASHEGRFEEAHAILEPLAENPDAGLAIRQLLARAMGQKAARYLVYAKPGASEACWEKCCEYAPWSPGYLIAQTMTALRSKPESASQAEEMLGMLHQQVGDRLVRGDIASVVGDAFFTCGDFERARQLYAQGLAAMSLPRYTNIHAQEGRLGL